MEDYMICMTHQIRLAVISLVCCLCLQGCGPGTPRTSLPTAIEKGNLKLVQMHIAAKTDLNKRDAEGWAPLHLAAMKGDLEIVKALVEAGADAKIKGKDGKTPLDVAREKKQAEVAAFLQGGGKEIKANQENKEKTGRRLIDGGLGVQDAMDNM
jgi:ankyrin repeat protein